MDAEEVRRKRREKLLQRAHLLDKGEAGAIVNMDPILD